MKFSADGFNEVIATNSETVKSQSVEEHLLLQILEQIQRQTEVLESMDYNISTQLLSIRERL